MKLGQLAVGKSYRDGKAAVRTIVEITSANLVFYMDDTHFIKNIPGQDFASWAKGFAPETPEHHRSCLLRKAFKGRN